MKVLAIISKIPSLVLVLFLATTTTNVVRAKVPTVNSGFLSSSSKAAGRNLQFNPSGGSNYQGDVPPSFQLDTYTYEDLSDYQHWPIGTPVLLEFADGWYEGKIANFSLSDDNKNATYIVTWSDDTSDIFFNELEWIDLMVANANDYEPWEMGTPVFGYPNPDSTNPDDAFLSGEITGFGEGLYTIKWSNGVVENFSDFDIVDMLVNNAGMNIDPSWMDFYEPWPVGTPVSWDFDDGWWDGTIKGFSDGTYEVEWSDGSSKYYSNLEKIDQMVAFANGDGFIGNLAPDHTPPYADFRGEDEDMYSDYYDLETVVYAEFQDGWWAGYVDSYQGEYYVVRWSDDSVDLFLPGDDMDEIVANSQYIPKEYNIYPVGTHVYKEFDGIWYWGVIEYSTGGFYTILWDDGQRTQYVSGAEIDEMVANAYDTGMSDSGKFALALLFLACFGGIVFFLFKRHQTKQDLANLTEQVKENELDLDEVENTQYSDQPAEGGKDSVV